MIDRVSQDSVVEKVEVKLNKEKERTPLRQQIDSHPKNHNHELALDFKRFMDE